MQLLLFDDPELRMHLAPLSLTRPTGAFRTGLLTHSEKWKAALGLSHEPGFKTSPELTPLFPFPQADNYLCIAGHLLPSEAFIAEIEKLTDFGYLTHQNKVVAAYLPASAMANFPEYPPSHFPKYEVAQKPQGIFRCWDIFAALDKALPQDFQVLTAGHVSASLPDHCQLIGPADLLFIEPGANVFGATFNTLQGPIYIGKYAEVMEGSMIRGPFGLAEHGVLKMGTKVYGPTAIGPHSKMGGELNNVQVFGFSNKAHDGFLGNAVLGEWCNLGADTNNSNLKNNYAEVKMWNYALNTFESTGKQFAGLVMGDHSKAGINTMFNTGTVVGVSCNIFGAGFPRNFIPDFTWGGPQGMTTYELTTAMVTMEKVLARRNMEVTEPIRTLFAHLAEQAKTKK